MELIRKGLFYYTKAEIEEMKKRKAERKARAKARAKRNLHRTGKSLNRLSAMYRRGTKPQIRRRQKVSRAIRLANGEREKKATRWGGTGW
jgi:hypothetical protein